MIPGPTAQFGSLGVYRHLIQFFRNPIATMMAYERKFGHLSGVLSGVADGDKGFIFAFGADYNREVFSNPQQYYSSAMLEIPDQSVRNLANGLTFMNGTEHITKRRLIMPTFHKRYIETYRDDMVAITEELLSTWQNGSVIDINQFCHDLTARIAIKTLFGLDSRQEGREMSELISQWMTLATSPMLRVVPIDLPLLPVRRLRYVSHRLEQQFHNLIERKRQASNQGTDVLATLMDATDDDGNQLTNDELIGQVNVLFLAGHETSGNALTWTLFLLSQYPHILGDVSDELQSNISGNAPTLEELAHLPLLDAVIKESMRVLPPVVWIQRIANSAVSLQNHDLGAGSTIILSHYMTHRNPEIYQNPNVFDPYRWETLKPATYEYMAFSAGPRRCIGAEFAMMEMKICLAMILKQFQLEMLPNARLDRHVTVTLSPKNGLPMRIKSTHEPLDVHTPSGDIHDLVTII